MIDLVNGRPKPAAIIPARDIAIVNRSTVVTDADLLSVIPALQMQISRDFLPYWGADALLSFVGSGQTPPAGDLWQCLVLDNSDEAGDLGYHVDDTGTPQAKVFAAETLKDGLMLSVTLSHELLEMLADPTASRTLAEKGVTDIVEICDPVESDEDGYDIDGVRVSNFATPAYFGLPNPGGDNQRYDFRALLKGPIPALRPGGYLMFLPDGANAWESTMARMKDGSLGRRAVRTHGRSRYRAAMR